MAGNGKNEQLIAHKDYLYVGNREPGGGTVIVDVSNPRSPEVCGLLPGYKGTISPKVQVVDDLLLVNYERRRDKDVEAERLGFGVFDLKDPKNPREIAYYHLGGRGVHRTWYSGEEKYAFISGIPEGFVNRMLVTFDMSDPAKPREVSRWWLPGQWKGGGETPDWPDTMECQLHHPVVKGNRAYLGMWDAGVYILDISDIAKPKEISHLRWAPKAGGRSHTALPLPGRNFLVTIEECRATPDKETPKSIRVIDISDETDMKVLSEIYSPTENPHRGNRVGPHNLHESRRPNSFMSENLIFATFFGAGLRIYDISDPRAPREVDSFIPAPEHAAHPFQATDVYVQKNGLVFLSDRSGNGIYVLEYDGVK